MYQFKLDSPPQEITISCPGEGFPLTEGLLMGDPNHNFLRRGRVRFPNRLLYNTKYGFKTIFGVFLFLFFNLQYGH